MNVEGRGSPGPLLRSTPAPATTQVWPQPGLTDIPKEGTEMRNAWGDHPTGKTLPLASVLGFQRVVGCLCPQAHGRLDTFLPLCPEHMLIKAESLQKISAWQSPAPLPWLAYPPRTSPPICPSKGVHKSSFRSPQGLAGLPWTSVTSRWKQLKTTWQKRRGDLMFRSKNTFFPRHSYSSPGGKTGCSPIPSGWDLGDPYCFLPCP